MESFDEMLRQLSLLALAEKSAIDIETPDPDYILDICVQTGGDPLVAAACSNNNIRLFVRDRLVLAGTFSGHTNTITGVMFGKTDPNILFSSAQDKTIRCWDVRSQSQAQVIEAPTKSTGDFLCVDVSGSDKLLCAGTEKVGEDAIVLFWDRRQSKLLGSYSECNDDDVTQVCFQPGSDRYLASGSADGLLVTFDLSEADEDDALLTTSNASSAINRVGWCGKDHNSVYCVTSDNMFYVWDAMEGDEHCSIENLNSLLREDSAIDYIIDCVPELTAVPDKSSTVLVTGTNSGSIQLVSHNAKSTSVFSTLDKGHTATVRCSRWDPKSKSLLTGGEDSLLCLWSTQINAKGSLPKVTGKLKTKVSRDDSKPYKKKRKS